MPELPEVETVRRGLAPVLEGAQIVVAKTNRADLRFPFPHHLDAILKGCRIVSLSRRAKYLLIHLDNGQTLISHLGMSGSWRIETMPLAAEYYPKGKLAAHDHFIMDLEQDSQIYQAVYNDPRRFGFLLLAPTATLNEHAMLAHLGIEPVGNRLDGDYLQQVFKGKKTPLKAALLDQSIIAGLGNIYVCEALWRSKLSPSRPAGTLSVKGKIARQQAKELAYTIRSVIEEAIAAGGSSLKDYVHTDGSLGYFQHHFSVYDREDQACPACGASIKRMVQSGRSTFYCLKCQI